MDARRVRGAQRALRSFQRPPEGSLAESNVLCSGSHDTRRNALLATLPRTEPPGRALWLLMPFFDGAIQFLGFDRQRKYESLSCNPVPPPSVLATESQRDSFAMNQLRGPMPEPRAR
jgi:hypothetical protein